LLRLGSSSGGCDRERVHVLFDGAQTGLAPIQVPGFKFNVNPARPVSLVDLRFAVHRTLTVAFERLFTHGEPEATMDA